MKQIFVICFFSVVSCQNNECKCDINTETISKNDSIINVLTNSPRRNLVDYWKRFDEPNLQSVQKESYRFSITVLLKDYFKVYRVENDEKDYKFLAKEYAVQTTSIQRKDSLISSVEKIITKKEWLEIAKIFEENCFWIMETDIKSDDGYIDGSGWTLEGFKQNNYCTNSKYHLAYRNSPDSSKFRQICEKFIELDSLNIRHF